MADATPDTPSSDYEAMAPYWTMVDAILGGAETMRGAGKEFLPQFPNETADNYKYRLDNSKFTNIYRDIVESISAKPFTKQLTIKDDSASDVVKGLAEDIDTRGNSLHVFAASTFFAAINKAVDWILVDYSQSAPNATLADEKAIGARPYWVHIPAVKIVAVYSDMVAGKEQIIHARVLENEIVRNGFEESSVERVRVFDRAKNEGGGYAPATWKLYEKRTVTLAGKSTTTWDEIGSGPISIDVIPLVPVVIGRRDEGSWRILPPMQDAAHLQIELYQQETNLKAAKELSCFPILTGNGVTPQIDPKTSLPVIPTIGPATILYAPMDANGRGGSWAFIEPNAASLKFLAEDVAATAKELRELGRQPLTAGTGNLTVVTTAFAASKGNSAIQAWALALKDAVEEALRLTCLWLNNASKPSVVIDTDFALDMNEDKAPTSLMDMRKNGDLSQETLWHEMKRRGTLSNDFDAEAEKKIISEEGPSMADVAEAEAAALAMSGKSKPVLRAN